MARETVAKLRKKLEDMETRTGSHIHNLENRHAIAVETEAWYANKVRALEDKLKQMVKDCGGCKQCRRRRGYSIFSEGTEAIYNSMFDMPELWLPYWDSQFKERWIRVDDPYGRPGKLSVDHTGHVHLSAHHASCMTTREERKYLRKGLRHLEQWHMANPCHSHTQTQGTCSGAKVGVPVAMKKLDP